MSLESWKMSLRYHFPDLYRSLLKIRKSTDVSGIRLSRDLSRAIDISKNKGKSFMVVQVGSDDGKGDLVSRNIQQSGYSALLIEPVPKVFERLVNNYSGNKDVQFCNAAVADIEGRLTFYMVSSDAATHLGDRLPHWWDQIGSFDRSHIAKHLGGMLNPFIESIEVDAKPLQKIVDQFGILVIDLLHIDAEGLDHVVLRSLDFTRVTPKVILFEHKHIPSREKREAQRFLEEYGYRVSYYRDDALAVLHH